MDGETFAQVDAAVEPGLTYWYRVGWQEDAAAAGWYVVGLQGGTLNAAHRLLLLR